jgi:hypothetical protein
MYMTVIHCLKSLSNERQDNWTNVTKIKIDVNYTHTSYCASQMFFFLQTEGKGVISISKSYYLRNTFHKAMAAIGGGGHAVAYWLRHYATSRKVAGSIPD